MYFFFSSVEKKYSKSFNGANNGYQRTSITFPFFYLKKKKFGPNWSCSSLSLAIIMVHIMLLLAPNNAYIVCLIHIDNLVVVLAHCSRRGHTNTHKSMPMMIYMFDNKAGII